MNAPVRVPEDTTRPSRAERQGPPPCIPDYELLRIIGRGSYGEVWLARAVTGTLRAVKVVYRRTFEDERPYEREFRGILKFEPISRTYESQVDVLHVGRNDAEGYFYYVMELADDERTGQEIQPDHYSPKTLKSELNLRQRLPFSECVELGLKLTIALEHLHQHGLVHRRDHINDVRNQAAANLSGFDARLVAQFPQFGASTVLFDKEGRRLLFAWGNVDGTVTICNLKDIHRRLTQLNLQW